MNPEGEDKSKTSLLEPKLSPYSFVLLSVLSFGCLLPTVCEARTRHSGGVSVFRAHD